MNSESITDFLRSFNELLNEYKSYGYSFFDYFESENPKEKFKVFKDRMIQDVNTKRIEKPKITVFRMFRRRV